MFSAKLQERLKLLDERLVCWNDHQFVLEEKKEQG